MANRTDHRTWVTSRQLETIDVEAVTEGIGELVNACREEAL